MKNKNESYDRLKFRPDGVINKVIRIIFNYFDEWTLFEKLWLLIFTLLNLYLFFIWQDTWIGLIASLTGMLCVVLTAKARISSFYYGTVNTLAYSFVAYKNAYYGDVLLNMLYYLPMNFIGIYIWNKNRKKDNKKEIIITSLNWNEKLKWLAISLTATALLGLFLKIIKGTLPFIDSSTTIFSIAAQIMLTKRLTDQWLYWILVNMLSIVMWVYIFINNKSDVSMLVMWSAFLINAIYGYYNWKMMEKKQNAK